MKEHMQRARKRHFLCISLLVLISLTHTQCRSENKDTVQTETPRHNTGIVLAKYTADAMETDINDISKNNIDVSTPNGTPAGSARQIQELIKQKNYAEAEKLCTAVLMTSPENNEIRYLRGMLNQKLNNTAQAIEDYDFLVRRDDADGKIFNNLGTIYAQQKKYTDAAELFSKAVRAKPQQVEFRNNLSEVLLEMKEYGRAIEEYNTLLSLEPDNISALYNLGVAYKNTGNYDKAKEQWEKVLAIQPADADAQNALEYLKKDKQ